MKFTTRSPSAPSLYSSVTLALPSFRTPSFVFVAARLMVPVSLTLTAPSIDLEWPSTTNSPWLRVSMPVQPKISVPFFQVVRSVVPSVTLGSMIVLASSATFMSAASPPVMVSVVPLRVRFVTVFSTAIAVPATRDATAATITVFTALP